jgi:hypothetical protein
LIVRIMEDSTKMTMERILYKCGAGLVLSSGKVFLLSWLILLFGTNASAQIGIAINVDGSTAETGVMLHVKGSTAKATSSSQTLFQIGSSDASASQLKLRMILSGNSTAGSRYGALEVVDYAGPVYRPFVLQPVDGQVGIGMTAPTSYLHIRPVTTDNTDATGLKSGITYNGGSAMANWYGLYVTAPTGSGSITNKYALVTESGSGNVGLGTTTPGAALEINGQIKITGGSPAASKMLTSDATGLATWQPYTAGTVEWSLDGTYLFIRPSDGINEEVAIGNTTVTPTSKLYVYSDNTLGNYATVKFQSDRSVSASAHTIMDLWYRNMASLGNFAGNNDKYIRFLRNGSEVGYVIGNDPDGVLYTNFTGGHAGQSEEDGSGWLPGMIVCARGNAEAPSMSNSLVKISLSKVACDPTAIGAYTGTEFPHSMQGMDPLRPVYTYNALGDGMIMVTDESGDIEIGDYITTSSQPGIGMKQADGRVHNYTVAKATDSVKWSNVPVDPKYGFKWKLMACTYHGG